MKVWISLKHSYVYGFPVFSGLMSSKTWQLHLLQQTLKLWGWKFVNVTLNATEM